MGKITDALKKVEQQREIQKQAWKDKQKDQPVSDERKDTVLSGTPPVRASEEKSQEIKQRQTRQLTLEERVKNLQERLKNRVYIAKATDNSGIDPRAVTYFNPSAPVSEQYRILRTNILSKSLNKSAKTFLITSAIHAEGKSVTALNLAIVLAQDFDKKVFLIDCDLRGGDIHRLLNIPLTPGLSNILADGVAFEIAFQNSKIKNLAVLTRGEMPSNPSELLGSLKMKRLLEGIKSKFDYIILDSPPVMAMTDAGILSAQSDGVMFVVQAGRTQERIVRQAQDLLQQARAKILGFILTHADYYAPGYRSYYYHYSDKQKRGQNYF